jgi:hypothetical protein
MVAEEVLSRKTKAARKEKRRADSGSMRHSLVARAAGGFYMGSARVQGLDSVVSTYTVRIVLARLSKLLIVLALASSIGLHWAFLQAVAWAGMVISYSQDRPVTEAVSETFDGQHPCKLCKQIAKEKQAEKKCEIQFESSKMKFSYVPVAFVFTMPSLYWEASVSDESAELLTHAPPLQPPRIFIG